MKIKLLELAQLCQKDRLGNHAYELKKHDDSLMKVEDY
jgi:hypothetical protein